MPRRITVTFADGSQHVYENAPDDVTPQQVVDRATQEFKKPVKGLDGGRGIVERTARAVSGIGSGIYNAVAGTPKQPLDDPNRPLDRSDARPLSLDEMGETGKILSLDPATAKVVAERSAAIDAERRKRLPKYQSIGAGLIGGANDLGMLSSSAIEAVGEVTGIDGLASAGAFGRKKFTGNNERNEADAGSRGRFSDIRTVGDAFGWAGQTAGNLVPVMIPSAAGSIAGAAAAPAAGLSATVGSVAGAFVPSLALGVGEVQANMKEKDPTNEADGWVFAGGTAIAALDSIVPGRIAGSLVQRFGREAAEEIALRALLRPAAKTSLGTVIKAGAKEAGKDALIEGVTESVEEAIGEVSAALSAEQTPNWAGLPEQMIEAGAAGALMGAGAGGFSGAVQGRADVRAQREANRGYQARVSSDAIAGMDPNGYDPLTNARLGRASAVGVRAAARAAAAAPSDEDIASPIPTDLILEGKASVADAEGKATADSILRAAGMPTTGTRVNVRMPDGTVRAGTMADAFMTDAGDMGVAAGLAVELDDGTNFTEHFDTLNEAGVTVTPFDAAAAANAAFDDVVNAAAQGTGFAAPGSGLLNPPALPAPAQQAEQPKGNRGTPVADGVAVAQALFPKARITSGYRDANYPLSQKNPNSWHTKSHAAVDMAPIPGMTFEQAKKTFSDAGYTLLEALNETGKGRTKHATGDHWHFVIGQGGSQQAGPRATSAPVGGESVQDDMFGGVSLTESQIAARDNVSRVLDEAVEEDDTFDLRKAARELEAARVDFEASGQGKFSDYVDPMTDIPMSLRQSIDANPNLLPLVLQRAGIEDAAANVAAPTEAQKEAGNYRKGHVRLHGLDITIETPRGAERSGTDPSGKAWSVSMPDHYGYVKRTEGADGEQVDVYVGPNPESTRVYLIDQNDADTGEFDEHKAMLGYRSRVDALDAYDNAFDDGRGPERVGNVVEMSTAEFKEWLKQPRTGPAGETMPQGTTGTGAAAPAAQPSSNPEQLPAAQENEGPLSTETMPGAGARNKLALRTHKVDGGYRVDADYELGGFAGGGLSVTGATPEAARAAMVERLGKQLDPSRFGSSANDQHRRAATKMLQWLRRGEKPAEPLSNAQQIAPASAARVEDTETGKGVAIIGASEADLAERVAERARLESELAGETAAAQKAIDEAAKVKEDVDPIEGVAEDGGPAYESTDDDPTDPDGPGSGSRNDQLDRRPELGRADRRDGVPVVRGMGIAARFDQYGATALVGETVSAPSELAALAQIYRDPRHETLRVFFTKGAQVVHATAVTTRSASQSPLLPGNLGQDAFVAWAEDTMATTGANGFYLMHNHPSGDPAPSPKDQELTAQIARKVNGFKGHVIINSNRYAVLDSLGREKLFDLPSAPDKLLTPSTPHPLVGQHITGPARLALVSKAAQLAQGDYFTIVIANPKNIVRAVIDVPRSELTRSDIILLGALRRYLRMSGGDRAYLVGTMADLALPAVRSAMRNGVLAGTVNENEIASKSPADAPDFLLGGPARAVAETRDPIDDSPAFDNGETERRFQDAKAGLATTQTFRERIAEGWEKAWHGITRHWIALPNEPRYAALQEKLRAIEAAPQSARERTIRMLDDMVKDFTDDDLDLFTRKVILDDLAFDAANQRELPFGFTPETLRAEKAKIDQLVKAQPDQRVHKAAMKRKLVNRKIAQELVDAGVLEAEAIKNPAYYRHQVLEYARAQAQYARTPGKKLRTPKWAKRMGSSLDINANLLEAEFDWLNKAFIDIPVAKTIEWIKQSEHNILDRLKKQAKDSNDEGVQRELNKARELIEQGGSSPEIEEAIALIEREKGFRQSIAMGFENVRTALENGEIDVPPRFAKAADGIENGKGSTNEPPFAFLSWMLDNDQPGAMGAAMIMKAISQRRVWTKNLLGRDYVDPQNADELVKRLAPEGYRTWQPDEGKLLFTVKTLPEHVIDGMIEKLETVAGIDQTAFRAALEGARSALAMGGDRYTMILPQEVADTLSQLRREEMDNLLDHFIKEPVKLWKRWVLINPRRFFKYNINNISGDLDAVIAGNPRSLRRIGAAGRELAEVMRGKAKASDRYNEAVARGVFDSGLSVQEIPDIHKLEPFERFAKKPGPINKITVLPLRKAWAALQGATQWRENVMRYAAYLDYVERIEAGESQKSIGYGASRPDMVDAVADPKDRAALLARDLLGDYGAISHYGGWLRQTIIPFWSWTEINTKRYWRLTMNAGSQGIGKGVATGGALAIAQGARTTAWLALRMAMLYGLFSLWNGLFFPDEEDELGEAQRTQMHVILGRNAEGEIISMRAQGALSDALSWFGLANIGKAAKEYELGRGSLSDILAASIKAPVNKIATSLSPVITVPVEAATGKKLWPDVFNTRANRDPWRNLFQTVSLENEYDMVQGLPSRGYGRSWQESFIYRRDPGEIAYNEGRGIAYDWLQREKGQSFEGGFSTPRGNAMRDYRTSQRYGDREAAAKALNEMVKLGVDAGDFRAMIKRAAPLGPIPKKDRAAFVAQLTEDERATMIRAQEWYNATFLGR